MGQLVVYKASSKVYRVTARGDDNAPLDLTGAVAHFQVKKTFGDAVPTIAKVSPSGITILNQTTNRGQYEVTLVPADTRTLAAGLYVFDSWVILASGFQHPVLVPDVMDLRQAVDSTV